MKKKLEFPRGIYACIEIEPETEEEGFLQYEVALFDRDGKQIGVEEYGNTYITEFFALAAATDRAYRLALRMLTRDEIMQLLDVAAKTECRDDFPSFIAKWFKDVFTGPQWENLTPLKTANTIYDFITRNYFQDADPHTLISRVKGSPWDEYPDHPQEDWRSEVSNGDTILGYWEWVEHRLVEAADERDCE